LSRTANPWLAELIARKPTKVAAVALANKLARIAWALLRGGDPIKRPQPLRRIKRADEPKELKSLAG